MFLRTKSIFLFRLNIRNGLNDCRENERMEKKEGKLGKRTRKGLDQENKKKQEQMSDEELDQLTLRNKLNKQKSRSNMSHQKKYAQKVKDKKHKSEVNDIVKESFKDYSTPRVQKYWQRKKEIQFVFFNWHSLHARLNSHCETWSYKKKEHKKFKAYRKSN